MKHLLRKARDVDYSDTQYLLENEDDIDWREYFRSRPPKEQVIQLMEKGISDEGFWYEAISDTEQHLMTDPDLLIKYQDKIIWWHFFECHALTDEKIKQLMSAIHNEDFESNLPYSYWSKEKLIKYQNKVKWDKYFETVCPDKEKIKELMSVITNEDFWGSLPCEYYTVDMLIENQNDIDWGDYFTKANYTDSQIKQLMCSVSNKDFWGNIPSEWLYDLEFNELNKIIKYVTKSIDISQVKCLNTNDEDLNKKRLNILISKSSDIASKFAVDIGTDFSKITDKDKIGNFFTIGKKNLHNQRVGAFVLFKINNDIHFVAEYGKEHSRMLMRYIKANNLQEKYSGTDIAKLFNVEANNEKIDKKFDLQQEKKLESEYNKEDIHSCFGYIHVDEDGNNPIAIMDNDRTYNFSPQQVAEIIKTKKFDGKPFIAVGIANSSTSNTSFMKVATKKRLNKTLDYTILYRFDNIILNRLLK